MKTTTLSISILIIIAASICGALASCQTDRWTLVWSEEFDGTALDETVWSRTDRGKPNWQDTQSKRADLLEIRDGVLILKGVVNENPINPADLIDQKITTDRDTAQFLTGGILSAGKKSFPPEGKIEVKAKLQGAKGAWPAIWLMPFERENTNWPKCGEIDIMERLNHDDIAYQTVHSSFTSHEPGNAEPIHGITGKIDPLGWNIYGVEFHKDSLVFSINGEKTFSYPRINTPEAIQDDQFPFIKNWYMLIDMQLGGSWVGSVDPDELPVQMEVDWVRQYIKK